MQQLLVYYIYYFKEKIQSQDTLSSQMSCATQILGFQPSIYAHRARVVIIIGTPTHPMVAGLAAYNPISCPDEAGINPGKGG